MPCIVMGMSPSPGELLLLLMMSLWFINLLLSPLPSKPPSSKTDTPPPFLRVCTNARLPAKYDAPTLGTVSQFKITTKISTDSMLYRKTSIRFREISNYGTGSSVRVTRMELQIIISVVEPDRGVDSTNEAMREKS